MNTAFYYQNPNAPGPNRPNHLGVVVLLRFRGKVLLEHRTDSEVWAFIGGALELDETLKAGAVREVKEETGISLQEDDLVLFGLYDDPSRIIAYPDGSVLRSVSVAYETELHTEPMLVCSDESRELCFFGPDELRKVTIAATHIPILQDVLKGKGV